MAKEIINQVGAETEPRITAGFEVSKKRLLAKVSVAAGALALAAGAMAGDKTGSVSGKHIGFVEERLFTSDASQADTIAQQIKQIGADSVKIFVPYTQGEAGNVGNDLDEFCNAAGAAAKAGLNLNVTFEGYFGPTASDPNAELGFVPQTSAEITRFNTTALVYEKALAGPDKPAQPNVKTMYRCASLPDKMTNFNFEIFNEWNLDTFVKPQKDTAGNWVAANNMVHLMERTYPALKKEAQRLGVSMNVWAGNLTSSHDPLGFIAAAGAVVKKEKVKLPIFDAWSHHPYNPSGAPYDKHPAGDLIGLSDADTSQLDRALVQAFGYKPPIVESEYGVQPTVPGSELDSYELPLIPNVAFVDETGQGNQYRDALNIVSCNQDIKGLFFFHFIDDKPAVAWGRSGIEYPDGTPKASFGIVKQAILNVRNGVNTCPAPSLK